MSVTISLGRRLTAEAVGTALLLSTVVGSGIMGDRLAGGNVAIALLANTIATGAGLVALILAFGPISGAHFNPAVTLADAWQGGMRWVDVPGYLLAQVVGGVFVAHFMFGEAPLTPTHVRAGASQFVSEVVATFGLLAVIWACSGRRLTAAPFAVGAYITAAYWFTAPTSFANPAVTIAFPDQHVRGDPSGRCTVVHRRSARGCRGGDCAVPLAPPHQPRRGADHHGVR